MIGTICAVLQAARQRFPFKAIWVVFQVSNLIFTVAKGNSLSYGVRFMLPESGFWDVGGSDLAASINGTPFEYISSLETVVDELVVRISKDLNRQIVVLTRLASSTLARNDL
uniref:Uncharacterized protein n=1 Tax=Quercus lobata TaxID=97700 RepID=A0A7N2MHY8_QUELO